MDMCREIGVYTSTLSLHGTHILPIFAWYNPQFDNDWDGSWRYKKGWLDFRRVVFPKELLEKEEEDPGVFCNFFLKLNEGEIEKLKNEEGDKITFSHFLPHRNLLPPKMFLGNKTLPLVVGDIKIFDQLQELGSNVHVYGHTHQCKDIKIEGIRFVQHSLGHVDEWKSLLSYEFSPKLIYSKKI